MRPRSGLILLALILGCARGATPAGETAAVATSTPIAAPSASDSTPGASTPEPTPAAASTPTPVPYPGPAQGIWLPVAPDLETRGFQGVQSRLVSVATGARCNHARVAIATNGDVLCYASSDGDVQCAGQFNGEIPSTTTFVPGRLRGVDQILLSPHLDPPWIAGASAICVHEINGTAWCRGSLEFREAGQFNRGAEGNPGAGWKQWGNRADIVELITGTWGQMCARYSDHTADCVGYLDPVFLPGLAPGTFPSRLPVHVAGPSPAAYALWIDPLNRDFVNDPDVARVAEDASCVVEPGAGLHCLVGPIADQPAVATFWGTAGTVVQGGLAGNTGGPPTSLTACWLDTHGRVTCVEPGGLRSYFSDVPGHAIALAVSADDGHLWVGSGGLSNGSMPPRCAVFDDGSLWCIGRNPNGAFGIGPITDVGFATQAAPPHSVQIQCETPGEDDDDD